MGSRGRPPEAEPRLLLKMEVNRHYRKRQKMKSSTLALSVDDIPNVLGAAVVTKEGSSLIGCARYVITNHLFAWMRQPSHYVRVVSRSGATPTTHI